MGPRGGAFSVILDIVTDVLSADLLTFLNHKTEQYW